MKNSVSAVVALVGLLSASVNGLAAQQVVDSAFAEKILSRTSMSVAPLALPTGTAQSVLILSGTAADKKVKVRMGRGTGAGFELALTAAGPLDESTGTGVIADLDGLRNASTLGLSLGKRWFHPRFDDAAAKQVCRDAGIDLTTGDCSRVWVMQNRPEILGQLERTIRVRSPWELGASVEVGRQEFNYTDPISLGKGKETRTPMAVKAGLGWLPKAWIWVGAAYRRERSYKAGQSTDLCRPLEGNDALACTSTALGPPKESSRSIVTAEGRFFISRRIAVATRAHNDLTDDITSVELPVYFLESEPDSFTGGISFGWTSDTAGWAVQLFVGRRLGFNIFG